MYYKKIIITQKGGIENLKLIQERKDLLYQNLQEGEAIIKVITAGVAYADIMMREGTYPGHPPYPFTPGYDIIGQVEEINDSSIFIKKGDYIGALTVYGGYSEYLKLPINKLIPIPFLNSNKSKTISNRTFSELVCLILNYITAYQMLFRIKNLNLEDNILIHGGGGGVGTALIQLGKYYNFTNLFTTISRKKYDFLIQYNIANITPIFYQEESFEDYCKKNKIYMDFIMDPIGGLHFLKSYQVLKRKGTLVLYGSYNFLKEGYVKSMLGFPLVYGINFFLLYPKNIVFYLIGKKSFGGYQSVKEDFLKIQELYFNNSIKPIIDTIYSFTEENVKMAHKRLQEGNVHGKIVLSML